MAIQSELMDKAVKEGISIPGQSPSDEIPSKSDANISAPSTEKSEQTPPSGEQTAEVKTLGSESVKKERFEDNPGFKNLRSQRDSLQAELKKAQEANDKLMAFLDKQNAPKENLSEQEAATMQLRKLLGFDSLTEKLEKLESRNSEYSQRETDSAYDKEEEKIISRCEKFKLDPTEVLPNLQNWLDEHPYFSKVAIQPGFYELAFNQIYFDKSLELSEKAAYAKQIEEKNKLKKGNTEGAGASTESGKAIRDVSIRDFAKRRIEESGGLTV